MPGVRNTAEPLREAPSREPGWGSEQRTKARSSEKRLSLNSGAALMKDGIARAVNGLDED